MQRYYPDDFRWPECPVSALNREHGPIPFDPVGIVEQISQARSVGGRAAVWALCKRDARMYDAAAVIEHCQNAAQKAYRRDVKPK